MAHNVKEFIQDGVFCPVHNFVGGGETNPTPGCTQCWRAFYTRLLSSFPVGEQQAKADELYDILARMVEMDEKGTFDYVPHRPIFEKESGDN